MDNSFNPFADGEILKAAPLTPEQEEIWLSIEIGGAEASLAYNEAVEVRLSGQLNITALRTALAQLVARHEALRLRFSGDGKSLLVYGSADVPLEVVELATQGESTRAERVAEAGRAAVRRVFDLQKGPLLRAELLVLGEREHVLLLTAHHLVMDGWSGAMLVEELGQLYSAGATGRRLELAPAPQFSDHAVFRRKEQESPEARADLNYWLAQFRELPPPLDLPLDHARPAERGFAADRLDVSIPSELVRELRVTAGRHGASLVALLLCAFQVFLHRLSGQRSIVVAMPVAGQSVVGQEALIGHCVRTLPLKLEVDADKPFAEHLVTARGRLLDGLEHPSVTFGDLLKELAIARDPSRVPLAPVLFNVDPEIRTPGYEGLEVAFASLPRAYENFELFVNATVKNGQIVLETTFSTSLFEREAMSRRMGEFVALLVSVVRDSRARVGELDMSTAEDRALFSELARTARDYPKRTLCSLFREQASRAPDSVAVVSGGRSLTYAELDRRSGALALHLCELGVGPGSLVGVALTRSPELLVGLLGILRAGGAYVPLDPEYPRDRLEFIVADAKLGLLVSEATVQDRIPSSPRRVLIESLALDSGSDFDASAFRQTAYVIYTSGSTGQPKGVVVQHENVTNFLCSMAESPGLHADDVLVAVTTPSFDISVLELFLPLTVGARVVIASELEVSDGFRLGELIEKSSATAIQATPAGYRVLLESGWAGRPGLMALCGGERLTDELAALLRSRTSAVYNCYGPTETTVWSTIERVEPGAAVRIGKPIGNTRVYVLDAALRRVLPGVVGELFIAGSGVAYGYLERDQLTRERFLDDPFAGRPGERMYRTGDLVRLGWDGRLDWLGRNDSQVKVRGHRIELGEIEAELRQVQGVREAVVIVREDRVGDPRIVAYVRKANEMTLDASMLTVALERRLPRYMLPQHVVFIAQFPLTPNGKIDRKALPAPERSAGTASEREPVTDTERRVVAEVAELLGVPRIGLCDDFFGLGGHSLLAVRLCARARAIWNVEVPLRTVFSRPTAAGIADFVEAALALREAPARPLPAAGEQEEILL